MRESTQTDTRTWKRPKPYSTLPGQTSALTIAAFPRGALRSPRKRIPTKTQDGKELFYVEGRHSIAEVNQIIKFDGWGRRTLEIKCASDSAAIAIADCYNIARVGNFIRERRR